MHAMWDIVAKVTSFEDDGRDGWGTGEGLKGVPARVVAEEEGGRMK